MLAACGLRLPVYIRLWVSAPGTTTPVATSMHAACAGQQHTLPSVLAALQVKLWDLQTRTCAQVGAGPAEDACGCWMQVACGCWVEEQAGLHSTSRPPMPAVQPTAATVQPSVPAIPSCVFRRRSASTATKCGACASARTAPASPPSQTTAPSACLTLRPECCGKRGAGTCNIEPS